jgi:hypothetical protein
MSANSAKERPGRHSGRLLSTVKIAVRRGV